MVAILAALLFVGALILAAGVIATMIGPQMHRIRALLDGSAHEVLPPEPIALRRLHRRVTRARLSPAAAALRAAA